MSKKTPPTSSVLDLRALPAVILITDIVQVFRLSERTIRDQVQKGTFRPMPRDKYPYRWYRDDVIAYFEGPSKRLTRRAHGFAAPKARKDDDD